MPAGLMRVVVREEYGSPEVLRLTEIERPVPTDDQVLIKIRAVSINGSDREGLIGKPLYSRMGGLRRPSHHILGSDIAGTVEAVGKDHKEFKVGDEVFGELPGYYGGFAEYVATHGRTLAPKPPELSFEEAAAIPQAGVIALNGIQIKGQVKEGQRVLINGAGGSAGSFSIQLAKLQGAEVTGVDNASKGDFMRSLGCDHVIDFASENFSQNGKRYDLILDLIAHRSIFACKRALAPGGTYFLVGGSVGVIFQLLVLGPLLRKASGRSLRMLVVPQNRKDLIAITELCKAGKVTPIIDITFRLSEVPEAMAHVAEDRAKGKVVITID